jgi:hypothetical protein
MLDREGLGVVDAEPFAPLLARGSVGELEEKVEVPAVMMLTKRPGHLRSQIRIRLSTRFSHMRSVKTTLLLRARLAVGSMVVDMVSSSPNVWDRPNIWRNALKPRASG